MEKKSFLFLQVRSSEEEQVELRRLQMQLALNNRRRCLNLVCLLLLLIPQRISQFLRFSSLLLSVSSRFNSLFFSLKSKTSSTPPNCQPVYTLIVFKYGTPHTEVVYPHQSIFRALEERGTHLFPLFPPFCSNRSKQAVYARQK